LEEENKMANIIKPSRGYKSIHCKCRWNENNLVDFLLDWIFNLIRLNAASQGITGRKAIR
jgi:hypothetical protein